MYKSSLFSVGFLAVIGICGIILNCGEASEQGPAIDRIVETGTVSGIFKFDGPLPEPDPLTFKPSVDVASCGSSIPNEMFVVSKETSGLANVVISFPEIAAEGKVPQGIQLRQKRCQYVPHVQAAMAGAVLVIINDDIILHNIHAFAGEEGPTLFNIAQTTSRYGVVIKRTLKNPGIVLFQCDIHLWMRAYIAVQSNQYFTVTDGSGNYTIENVPAGNHVIQAWHETFPEPITKTITIVAGKILTEDFVISLK